MVLIISEETDLSTFRVIDWFLFHKIDYVLIFDTDLLRIDFKGNDITFHKEETNIKFSLSEIKGVWYRRGRINFNLKEINNLQLNNFLSIEKSKITEYIYYKLSLLPSINHYYRKDTNKLIVAEIAEELGIKIPKSFLVNKGDYLQKTQKNTQKGLATKSISGSSMFNINNNIAVSYTRVIDDDDIGENDFFPSYIQEYIEKKYELRIFFIETEFWAMAIFSQNDDQTKTDFRNYNHSKPNRNIPYVLPKELEEKLIRLSKKTGVNCGSIDMIVTKNDEYIFLEINPIGQFGMVSNPCNYYLHERIALFFKEL